MVFTPGASPESDVAFGTVACAVTLRNDEILLLRRSMNENFLPGRWTLPAGKLQDGELAETAVLRELKEETGLSGELVRPTGTSSFKSSYQGRPTEWTQFNFVVDVLGRQEPMLDASHCDHQWLPVAARASLDYLVDMFTMQVIEQAFPHSG